MTFSPRVLPRLLAGLLCVAGGLGLAWPDAAPRDARPAANPAAMRPVSLAAGPSHSFTADPVSGRSSYRSSGRFAAIADVRVGDRVLGADAADPTVHPTAVDPATWRKLTLRADQVWPDGSLDDWHVQTLQPPGWLAAHNAGVGSVVPAPLDLAEMGAPEGVVFRVAAIEPCPVPQEAPGWVVLTTVNHRNAARVDVHVVPADQPQAVPEVIETTAPHKFCRLPRSATAAEGGPVALPAGVQDMEAHPNWWASAGELRPGDRLPTPSGTAIVHRVVHRPGSERVYNLTVESEHLFRVGHDALLVHNNGCDNFDKSFKGLIFPDANKLRRKIHQSSGKSNTKGKLYALRREYPELIGLKRDQIAERVPGIVGKVIDRTSGRQGRFSGEEVVFFDDGAVTWVFLRNGQFKSVISNIPQ